MKIIFLSIKTFTAERAEAAEKMMFQPKTPNESTDAEYACVKIAARIPLSSLFTNFQISAFSAPSAVKKTPNFPAGKNGVSINELPAFPAEG
jgi:hypothetical protein